MSEYWKGYSFRENGKVSYCWKEQMMKKMLILMLVLGIASAANAQLEPQLSIYVNGADVGDTYTMMSGSVINIGIYSDGVGGVNGKYAGVAVINANATDTGTGNWQGTPVAYDGPGEPLEFLSEGVVAVLPNAQVARFVATNAVLADYAQEGIGFEFEYLCTSGLNAPDIVTITLIEDGSGPHDVLTITQIPEPITFALLGLGGLFLRRRK
jgi:hypothetical protein